MTDTLGVHRRPYGGGYLKFEKVLGVAYTGEWPRAIGAMWPGTRRLRVVEHTLDFGRGERPPLRIGFLSDLHVGPTTPHCVLRKAFETLAAADPDVLALGGDYVFLGATGARVRLLKELVRTVPTRIKVAVLGNHDWWARPERLADALQDAGVRVLVNEALALDSPHDDVAILGLDDPLTGASALEPALAAVAKRPVKIVICHSPDGYPAVRGRDIRLFLSGHTHGGQIARPGGIPLWMPSKYGRRWPHGLHEVDGLQLYVSRGVGCSMLPLRTWAPPDVTLFHLR